VASTPVLTTEQRKHLQELQKKEHTLKEQIQLLQEEYQNLDLVMMSFLAEIFVWSYCSVQIKNSFLPAYNL
jgi:cell division protein FtsB